MNKNIKSKKLGVPARKAERSASSGVPSAKKRTATRPPSASRARAQATKERVDELQAQLNAAKEKLYREQKRELLPRMRAELVGSCWKYHNTYGGEPEKRKYWWTYRIVTSVVDISFDQPRVNVFEFDTDCDGAFRAKAEKWSSMYGGWTRVSPSEMERAWGSCMAQLKQTAAIARLVALAGGGKPKAVPAKQDRSEA